MLSERISTLLRRIAMILLSIIVLMISWMKKGFPSDRLRIRSSMGCGTASTSIRSFISFRASLRVSLLRSITCAPSEIFRAWAYSSR